MNLECIGQSYKFYLRKFIENSEIMTQSETMKKRYQFDSAYAPEIIRKLI